MSVWYQTLTRVPTESNFYNTCPTDMKLNQGGQDMSLPVVIQFGGNPCFNKKITFNFTFLILLSLRRRRQRREGGKKMLKSFLAAVLLSASNERFFVFLMRDFCHEDSGGDPCKLVILIVIF